MTDAKKEWVPPAKIEDLYAATAGNQFAAINAPTAGARQQVDNIVGSAPLQLYSLATPNGHKVAIMLEELGVDYDAYVVNIGKGEQFNS
jgi:GST-like protein